MVLDDIKTLYAEYASEVERLEGSRKLGDGLFGMGKKVSDDPCHDQFSARLEELLKDFAATSPASSEVSEVLSYIYNVQKDHRDFVSAYWLMNAVHGFTVELISFLTPQDAGELAEQYEKICPRSERFPVQKKVLKALKSAAK